MSAEAEDELSRQRGGHQSGGSGGSGGELIGEKDDGRVLSVGPNGLFQVVAKAAHGNKDGMGSGVAAAVGGGADGGGSGGGVDEDEYKSAAREALALARQERLAAKSEARRARKIAQREAIAAATELEALKLLSKFLSPSPPI